MFGAIGAMHAIMSATRYYSSHWDTLSETKEIHDISRIPIDIESLDRILSTLPEARVILDRMASLAQERARYLTSLEEVFVEQEPTRGGRRRYREPFEQERLVVGREKDSERWVDRHEHCCDYESAAIHSSNRAAGLRVYCPVEQRDVLIDYWTLRANLNWRRKKLVENIKFEEYQKKQRILRGVV